MLGFHGKKNWLMVAGILASLFLPGVHADEAPVDVNPSGDAEGQLAGVSVTGDSYGLVAVSVFGDAVATYILYYLPASPAAVPGGTTIYQGGVAAVSGTGDAAGYIAASGTGNANARDTGLLTPGGAALFAYQLVGFSGTGDASGAVAVSGVGAADGDTLGVSGCDGVGLCTLPLQPSTTAVPNP